MSCAIYDLKTQFVCSGPLIFTPSDGIYRLSCTTTEENNTEHDCVCSATQDFNIETCGQGQTSQCPASYRHDEKQCKIVWKGQHGDAVDVLPFSCQAVLVSQECKTRCTRRQVDERYEVTCQNTVTCSASRDQGPKSGNKCSSLTSDVITSTQKVITGTSTGNHNASNGNTVIALGVVTGLVVVALVISLVLLYIQQRRKRRSKPPTIDYMDMNIGEVGSTTYDSPAGISNQYERLGREHLHANDRKSGLYLDLDNKTVEETDQVKHSARDSEEMDSVYNTIDEQVPTGHGDDNVNQTKLPSDSGDINTATANYFILEKHEEEKTSETAEVLTEDPNPTEDYFVLDKDENQAKSEPTDNHPDSGITVVNRSDNYSISEEQQSPENQTSDNYFLLEEENNGNLKEDAPDDDKYDVLNKDTNDETSEYYSHAKTVESSQESTSRDENLHENNENYDKLFQRPNSNVIHDSDSDYDHMNNDDLLTSL